MYSKPNLREATQDQYTNFLEKHLIPNIGDIPLEQLTSLRVQKMYQDLRTSGCAEESCCSRNTHFTLDTYTHVTAKMQQEAAEKMGSFMEMAL